MKTNKIDFEHLNKVLKDQRKYAKSVYQDLETCDRISDRHDLMHFRLTNTQKYLDKLEKKLDQLITIYPVLLGFVFCLFVVVLLWVIV